MDYGTSLFQNFPDRALVELPWHHFPKLSTRDLTPAIRKVLTRIVSPRSALRMNNPPQLPNWFKVSFVLRSSEGNKLDPSSLSLLPPLLVSKTFVSRCVPAILSLQ